MLQPPRRGLLRVLFVLMLFLDGIAVTAQENGAGPPAVLVQARRPGVQLERLLGLFEGTAAANPAAALAAWRRATGNHEGIGKAEQALIALLNPEMVRELRVLDGGEFRLNFDAAHNRWHVRFPGDDGSLAALGTAALTEGGTEPPLENGALVDRLGPPGASAVLMARAPAGAVALASSRADLEAALHWATSAPLPTRNETGWRVTLDPRALGAGDPSLGRRRLVAALDAVQCRRVDVAATLEADALSVTIIGDYAAAPPTTTVIAPEWLDWAPADRVAAVAAPALDPSAAAWDRAFALADRIEKADPAQARAAALRTRFNLAALAAGVRPEADLWPHLRGLTVSAAVDAEGRLAALALVLHAVDPAAAERIAARIVLPLEKTLGRRLDRAVIGASVVLAFGEGWLDACRHAAQHPDRASAGPALRAAWPGPAPSPPQRAGAIWPGRAFPAGDFGPRLEAAPPVVWWGTAGTTATTTRDRLQWKGLHEMVRAALRRIPMKADESLQTGAPGE